MQMDVGMDTGDILMTREFAIPEDMTAGGLFDALAPLGGRLIVQTLAGLEEGTLTPIPQDNGQATYAPMLDRSLSLVDWSRPAQEIHNQIRGLSPWPSAKTVVNGQGLKLHASRVLSPCQGKPGQVLEENRLVVCCGDGVALHLQRVQLEGSRQMSDEELLRGHPLAKGTVLGRCDAT